MRSLVFGVFVFDRSTRGSTYWRYGWDGSEEVALDFMDEAAELQGANVGDDRRQGPVLWDDVPRRGRKHS
jgi:hypothetical protein